MEKEMSIALKKVNKPDPKSRLQKLVYLKRENWDFLEKIKMDHNFEGLEDTIEYLLDRSYVKV